MFIPSVNGSSERGHRPIFNTLFSLGSAVWHPSCYVCGEELGGYLNMQQQSFPSLGKKEGEEPMTKHYLHHFGCMLFVTGLIGCGNGQIGLGGDGELGSSQNALRNSPHVATFPIDDCGLTIDGTENPSGDYVLSANLVLAGSGTCITFDPVDPTKELTLDCRYRNISGTNRVGTGIRVKNGAILTLRNCEIEDLEYGVVSNSGTTVTSVESHYRQSDYGIKNQGELIVESGGFSDLWAGIFQTGYPSHTVVKSDVHMRFCEYAVTVGMGEVRIEGGTFLINQIGLHVFGEGHGIIDGGDFGWHDIVAKAWIVSAQAMLTINGGLFHDSFYSAVDARNWISGHVGLFINGGTFLRNGTGVFLEGVGNSQISGGRFRDNSLLDVDEQGGTLDLVGGSLCSVGITNIGVSGGALTGAGAECRSVNPSSAYRCRPCTEVPNLAE